MIAGITSKAHQKPGGLFSLWVERRLVASDARGGLYRGGWRFGRFTPRAHDGCGRMQDELKGKACWFVAATWIVGISNDGWSGRPSPLIHQVLLIPVAFGFAYSLLQLLRPQPNARSFAHSEVGRLSFGLGLMCCLSEVLSVAGFLYEGHHFARFGYVLPSGGVLLIAGFSLAGLLYASQSPTGLGVLTAVLMSYVAGLVLAIVHFPLNYLRSDMLPVILWTDSRLAAHLNPYVTMHVGSRLYDFPYLPGMLIAYLPAGLVHVDLRFTNLISDVGLGVVSYTAAVHDRRRMAALLIGVFLLSPFLQYRHDLYLAPHWLTLVGAVALMRWRHFAWAALVFGLSMGIYQLSWVIFPFLILNGYRRGGWREAIKLTALSGAGMLAVVGPFLAWASRRIANNTVGQWSKLPHALADPINLSYWVTFVVRPDHLEWVQLVVLTAMFAFCIVHGRCRSLLDTLRWMSAALAVFIALNVLVDGYFYLTLLLLMLLYTFVATGTWPDPMDDGELSRTA